MLIRRLAGKKKKIRREKRIQKCSSPKIIVYLFSWRGSDPVLIYLKKNLINPAYGTHHLTSIPVPKREGCVGGVDSCFIYSTLFKKYWNPAEL